MLHLKSGKINKRITRSLAMCLLFAMTVSKVDAHDRMVGMGEGKDSITFASITATGLWVLDVNTEQGVWPTADYVYAPEGAWGLSIVNATDVPGRLMILDGNSVIYDSGDYVQDAKGMTLRLRGNSSAFYAKKPYKITLQDKADLLKRNNPSFRDKHWLLIRDDEQFVAQGFELNRLLGMPWTPGYRYVNVVINNEYCGVYMLVESVRRNTNCRINISKNGFLFELDPYWWKVDTYIESCLGFPVHYTFKYPETEELTDGDVAFMTDLLQKYEASMFNGHYEDYIDVDSYAKWTLGHDILSTNDAAGSNMYYMKYDRSASSKMVMPLMWDFTSQETDTARWARVHRDQYSPFFRNSNKIFLAAYVEHWHAIKEVLCDGMADALNGLKTSAQGKGLYASMTLNNRRWGTYYSPYSSIYKRVQWFKLRMPWLSRNIDALVARGDVNIDGVVDVADVNLLINMVLGKIAPALWKGDLTGDGTIDVGDVNALINIVLATQEPETK